MLLLLLLQDEVVVGGLHDGLGGLVEPLLLEEIVTEAVLVFEGLIIRLTVLRGITRLGMLPSTLPMGWWDTEAILEQLPRSCQIAGSGIRLASIVGGVVLPLVGCGRAILRDCSLLVHVVPWVT